MVFCGKCGEENPEGATFCWKCGSKLINNQTCGYTEQLPNNQNVVNHEYDQHTTSSESPHVKAEHVEQYRGVEMRLSGDTVTLTEKVSKEECDRYRVPTILFGIICGIFIIVATCLLECPYNVSIHDTDTTIGTEMYTMLDMVSNGWGSGITVFFILILLCAIGGFYYYGLESISILLGLMSLIFTSEVDGVKSGLLSYDYSLDIMSTGVIGIPVIIIGIVGIILLGIAEFCFFKFCKQFGLKVPLTRALKELWKFN